LSRPSKQCLEELVDRFGCEQLLNHPNKLLEAVEADKFDSMQPRYRPNIVYQVELVDKFVQKKL
jgi:hypothetical protein